VLMRYREFRLFVKIYTGLLGNSCVSIYKVWWIADISARSMFYSSISLWGRFILSSGFQMR
jgi:hypothetical protein